MRVDELHEKLMMGMSPAEQARFREGLKVLNMADSSDRAALRESIQRLRSDFTEEQIDLFIDGEIKPEREPEDLEESFVRLGLPRPQAKIAAKVRNLGYSEPSYGGDREALIASLKQMHPDWTDRHIEIFLNPDGK